MAGPRVNAFAGRSAHVNLREAHIHGWRSHMCADVVATMRTQVGSDGLGPLGSFGGEGACRACTTVPVR